MLHTKFGGKWNFLLQEQVLEKKIFEVFLPYMGHLGHVNQMPRTNFRSPYPRRLHIKFGFDWPSGLVEDV